MYNITVFSQDDAHKLLELGFRFVQTRTDVNGQDVYEFICPKNLSFSESDLPQSAVIKHCVCMNFQRKEEA